MGASLGLAAKATLTVVLAKLLGTDSYGLLFLSISVFSVVQFFSRLGIAQSAARYVAERKEQDPGQIPYILKWSLLFSLVTITTTCLSFALLRGRIADLMGEPALEPFLLVGISFVALSSLRSFGRQISQGFEDIQLAAAIQVIQRVSQAVVAIGLVLLGYGALGALGGFILGEFLGAVFGLGTIYNRYYRGIDRGASIENGLLRRIAEYSLPLTLTRVSHKLDNQVDTILVGFYLNPVAVGYYALANQIVRFVGVPMNVLGFTLSPTYGKQNANEELSAAARLYEESLAHTLVFYLPAAMGMILIADPAIEYVFGADYAGAVPVIQVLAVYTAVLAVTKVTNRPLDFLGRARDRSIIRGLTAVGNFVLNVVLIPEFGVVGAAVATVLTHSVYACVSVAIILTEIPVDMRSLGENVLKTGLVAGTLGIFVWLLSGQISGIISLVTVIVASIPVWAILSVLSGVVNHRAILDAISSS
jgi:O-antigen/teichoic acid export membrane protein